jgi:hypothetical protein
MKNCILTLLVLALTTTFGMAQTIDLESDTYSFSFGVSNTSNKVRQSDVDVNIPVTKTVNDKTFVVIIANEDYQKEQKVPFAIHDGEVFRQYCIQTLGIPEKNIRMESNATLNNMKHEVLWLKNTIVAFKGEAKGVVYYSGHGIPNEASRGAYLLPVDGYANDPESGYSLDKLYSDLGSVTAQSVTYFIDACFSGANRNGEMLVENKGGAIKSKTGVLKGNAVAFSAAQGDETAYAYYDKSHGMFTYFLLKKLQESKGDVNYGDLADFINDKVTKMSIVENSKMQTPTANASTSLVDTWRKCKFK